jgi:hypothetical protein
MIIPFLLKEKKGAGLYIGKVPKPTIDRGSKVTEISSVIQSAHFLFAGFKIVKKIIYYSTFFLALVIISDIIINELSVI